MSQSHGSPHTPTVQHGLPPEAARKPIRPSQAAVSLLRRLVWSSLGLVVLPFFVLVSHHARAEVGNAAFPSPASSGENTQSSKEALKSSRRPPTATGKVVSGSHEFWIPLGSYFLPGLGQWIEADTPKAATYSGVAAVSAATLFYIHRHDPSLPGAHFEDRLLRKDWAARRFGLVAQSYLAAGGLSSYEAFRVEIAGAQKAGRYGFLGEQESTRDLMLASFRFDFLARPTTSLFLGVVGLINWAGYKQGVSDRHFERSAFTGADAATAFGQSYLAGTGEEAAWRGWVLPTLYERTGSMLWANSLQAGLFMVSHQASNGQFSLYQALIGAYFGYVSQVRAWTISEAIFLHTWADVFSFVAVYQLRKKLPGDEQAAVRPILWLPPLELSF